MNKTKITSIILVLSLVFFGLTACEEGNGGISSTYYNLKIDVNGEGTTDPSPGVNSYEEFSSAEVKAIPNDGWLFKNWEGDVPSYIENDKTISLSMTENKNITAVFEEEPFGTKNKPAGFNETISRNTNEYFLYDTLNYEITLIDYIKGDKAWEIIDDATYIVDEPGPNEEFYLLKFEIDVIEVKEEPFDVSSYYVEAVSNNDDVYDDSASDIGLGNSDLDGGTLSTDIYSGGSTTGWVYILVDKDDDPYFTFLRKNKGVWFKIK